MMRPLYPYPQCLSTTCQLFLFFGVLSSDVRAGLSLHDGSSPTLGPRPLSPLDLARMIAPSDDIVESPSSRSVPTSPNADNSPSKRSRVSQCHSETPSSHSRGSVTDSIFSALGASRHRFVRSVLRPVGRQLARDRLLRRLVPALGDLREGVPGDTGAEDFEADNVREKCHLRALTDPGVGESSSHLYCAICLTDGKDSADLAQKLRRRSQKIVEMASEEEVEQSSPRPVSSADEYDIFDSRMMIFPGCGGPTPPTLMPEVEVEAQRQRGWSASSSSSADGAASPSAVELAECVGAVVEHESSSQRAEDNVDLAAEELTQFSIQLPCGHALCVEDKNRLERDFFTPPSQLEHRNHPVFEHSQVVDLGLRRRSAGTSKEGVDSSPVTGRSSSSSAGSRGRAFSSSSDDIVASPSSLQAGAAVLMHQASACSDGADDSSSRPRSWSWPSLSSEKRDNGAEKKDLHVWLRPGDRQELQDFMFGDAGLCVVIAESENEWVKRNRFPGDLKELFSDSAADLQEEIVHEEIVDEGIVLGQQERAVELEQTGMTSLTLGIKTQESIQALCGHGRGHIVCGAV